MKKISIGEYGKLNKPSGHLTCLGMKVCGVGGGGLILIRVGGGGDNPYKGWKGGRTPRSVRLLEARGRGRPSHQRREGEGF